MSAALNLKLKTIVIDGVEYILFPKNEKFILSINDLADKTPYTVNTLYKIKDEMTEGLHYKSNGGKILFALDSVAFLWDRIKGERKNESKQGNSISEERQSLSVAELLDQWKTDNV